MGKRNHLIPPHDVPVRVHWVLPSSFAEETAGQFTEEARRTIIGGKISWSTIIRDHNQKDYLNIDVGDVSFPGFLPGDMLDNGQPAVNEYVVTLSKYAAQLMASFFHLLWRYGATDIEWEALESTPTAS
jgi:hypothetical protein